jgi:hypothetical protein
VFVDNSIWSAEANNTIPVGICHRNIGSSRECRFKIFGYDPAATRNAPKRSVAGRVFRKDDCLAKAAYFTVLRAEVPELMKIGTGNEARPPELDTFAAAFAVAGEKQEMVADYETPVLLKRFSRVPDVEKVKAEFERAQRTEERFHKDFDGLDFAVR